MTFAAAPPLVLPAATQLQITCGGPAVRLHLHSVRGALAVPRGSSLTVRGCHVTTLPSLVAAAEPYLPPELSQAVFGESSGRIAIEDSRMLFPLQVRPAHAASRRNHMHVFHACRSCQNVRTPQPAVSWNRAQALDAARLCVGVH